MYDYWLIRKYIPAQEALALIDNSKVWNDAALGEPEEVGLKVHIVYLPIAGKIRYHTPMSSNCKLPEVIYH